MKILKAISFFLLCMSISIGVVAAKDHHKDQLAGRWKSPAPEDIGDGNYSTREFTFNEKSWKVEAVFFRDQQTQNPLLSFTAEGPYRLEDASSVVIGATNAVFSFSKKTVTLLSSDPAVISRFNLANCNLIVGVPKDISITGCSFFTSIPQCAQEYDLVKIEDNTLRLGMRPADRNMCDEDKRPKALGLPVKKVHHHP
jgi:Adenomatosis polyposis coli down-regulated 1